MSMPSEQEVPGAKASKRKKAPGIRELTRQEHQHRIMAAARELFAELGYQQATLRQIAAKAGITAAALFNHVKGKRDLVYLLLNEEIDKIVDVALASPRHWQSLRDKILTITEHYMRMFGSEPVLSRTLLTEIVALSPGDELSRYLTTSGKLVDGLERMVAEAQASGEIQSQEEAKVIARNIFFLFAASLRFWLASSTRPEWRDGHREFERHLNLLMHGLLREPASADSAPGKPAAPRNPAERQQRGR